jgi:predicted Rossmann-fold nucleotide-binding protein
MKAIGIFCGSSSGENPLYIETARDVGKILATADISLVYGGGKVGLMGAVADACLAWRTCGGGYASRAVRKGDRSPGAE